MRRIKKAKINFISLVPKGANKMPVIYKSEDDTVEIRTLIKSDIDNGEITAVVYAPELRDSQGDIASAEVIREMAHEFSKNGKGIDIRHNGEVLSKEDAYVAESYIIKDGDPDFADMTDYEGNPVDVTGGWAAVIKVENSELRQAYRDGEWNGVSMGGTAEVEAEKESDGLTQLIKMLASKCGLISKGDSDMKPEDLNKALEDNNKALGDTLVKGLSEVLKDAGVITEPDKGEDTFDTPEAPVFKGDLSSEEDRKAHRKALAIWKAETTIDDPVERFDAIEKIEKEFSEDDSDIDSKAGVEKGDSPEVASLKRRLHKAQRTSNRPAEKEDKEYEGLAPGVTKEDVDLMKEAVDSVRKEHYGETE